jgi:hypothetical protein
VNFAGYSAVSFWASLPKVFDPLSKSLFIASFIFIGSFQPLALLSDEGLKNFRK